MIGTEQVMSKKRNPRSPDPVRLKPIPRELIQRRIELAAARGQKVTKSGLVNDCVVFAMLISQDADDSATRAAKYAFVEELRNEGKSYDEIAELLRQRFGPNKRKVNS